MVKTVQEPIATTPQILRVSISSATSSRRPSASPSQPTFTKSSTAQRTASRPSTVSKRPVLGERSDNVIIDTPRRSIKPKVKSVPKHRASPNRISLNSLSRLIAKSTSKTAAHSSPAFSLASPDASFMSQPGSTPYPPRLSMNLHMQLNEDDTLLVNIRPPELDFSSPGYGLTDDEDDTVEYGRDQVFRGGLMTPANSQDLQNGSPQANNSGRHPISRLPTPPSSQAGASTSIITQGSRVRPRPADTPPRRISTEPSVVLDDITAEWDTPLRLGDDPSPNPRRKKSPRVGQLAAEAASRLRSPFDPTDRVEIVLPSRASSLGRSTSATPATIKAKGRGRASKSRYPVATLSQSTSSNGNQRSSGGSRRTSGESRASVKATPAQTRIRTVPSTAPAASRRSATPKVARTTQVPLTVQAKGRKSTLPAAKTPRGRSRKSMTPSLQDVLSGRKLGFLPRPIHGSPGDDPLLLRGGEDIVGPEVRDKTGLGLDFASTESQPLTDHSIRPSPLEEHEDFYPAPAWSDDGSDDGPAAEDTFVHVLSRRDMLSTATGIPGQVIAEEEEADPQPLSHDPSPASPFVPPRLLDESIEMEQSLSEADVTRDGDGSAWDLSTGRISPIWSEQKEEQEHILDHVLLPVANEEQRDETVTATSMTPSPVDEVTRLPVEDEGVNNEEQTILSSAQDSSDGIPSTYAPSSPISKVEANHPQLRAVRAASVPRSPFVLIKHRDVSTTSVLRSIQQPRARSLSLPSETEPVLICLTEGSTPYISIAETSEPADDLDEREIDQRAPADDVDAQALAYSNEIDTPSVRSLVDSSSGLLRVSEEANTATESATELRGVEHESASHAGDVTADADSLAWDLSNGEINGLADDLQQNVVVTAETVADHSASDRDNSSRDEWEAGNQNQCEHLDAATPASPQSQGLPERIVLRLIDTGIIKIEAESDDEETEEVEAGEPVEIANTRPSSDVAQTPRETEETANSPSTPGRMDCPVAHISTTPLDSPTRPGPSTPSIYPAVQCLASSSTPTRPFASFITTFGHALANDETQSIRQVVSSKLSQQINYASPPASKAKDIEGSVEHERADEADEHQDGDQSIRVCQPRRSLHDELAAFAVEDEDIGDDSFKSVVEVSSLDPKAAARAAAILKMNHAYVERGIIPRSTKDEISIEQSTSRRKSLGARDFDKRALLHEAELELVELQRRSRSRSLSRARSMSVFSHATEDLPIPGGYIKTPFKRKRARTPLPLTRGRLEPIEKIDGAWGVAEWKRLEKVYRHERQAWVKEREVKPMPGGLMAWARRSTVGSNGGSAKEWDSERVVKSFMEQEGEHPGAEWDRATIVLRIQAIERRVNKLSRMAATNLSDMSTPSTKRLKPTALTSRADETYEETSTILQTPQIVSHTAARVEPPSTIRRMLGLVWGRGKKNGPTAGQNLLGRLEAVKDDKGQGKEVLPVSMVQVATIPPTSPLANTRGSPARDALPLPPTAISLPARPFTFHTTTPIPTMSTPAPASSSSTTSAFRRLYPPLNPPITQRSSAIAALFPDNDTLSLSTSSSLSSITRSISIPQKQRGSNVKDLVKSFEDKGLLARSTSRTSSGESGEASRSISDSSTGV